MAIRFYLYYAIISVIVFSCEFDLPPDKTLKICQKPTGIMAIVDANNPLKYTISLAGATSDIAGQVIWKVVSGNTVLSQTQAVSTNAISISLPSGGTYTITAEAQTTCNDKTILNQDIVLNGVYTIWDKVYGGSDSDNFSTILATLDGGYLLAGSSTSNVSGDKGENSRGKSDFWIVKTNENGVKQWDKTFGGISLDNLSTAIATPDGGFLLGGWSDSNLSGDKSENSRGNLDFWVVKINGNGVKQWDKTYGGVGVDYLTSITPVSDGGFLLGGSSNSNISNDKSDSNRGGWDFWIVKINGNGVKQWDKTFGGTDNDYLNTIITTPDAGFILGGLSYSTISNEKSENSRGSGDFWVIKSNSLGEKQWDKTFGGLLFEDLRKAIVAPDGSVLLAGHSSSNASNDKSESNRGDFDFWIVKINQNGVKQWDKTFGGTREEQLNSMLITVTADNSFLIGGQSNSSVSNEKSENNRGLIDFWLVKINTNGVKQWDRTFGGTGEDQLTSMATTTDGGFMLGGTSTSNAGFDKSENSRGGQDYWIIKVK